MHNFSTRNNRYSFHPNTEMNPETLIVMRNGMRLTWFAYVALKEIHYNDLSEFSPDYMND